MIETASLKTVLCRMCYQPADIVRTLEEGNAGHAPAPGHYHDSEAVLVQVMCFPCGNSFRTMTFYRCQCGWDGETNPMAKALRARWHV